MGLRACPSSLAAVKYPIMTTVKCLAIKFTIPVCVVFDSSIESSGDECLNQKQSHDEITFHTLIESAIFEYLSCKLDFL